MGGVPIHCDSGTGFCVRCRNVANQIAVSSNQHKQHLNITCSKCTLVFLKIEAACTAIVPARPCLLLTRLYRWQYPGPKQELAIRHFLRGNRHSYQPSRFLLEYPAKTPLIPLSRYPALAPQIPTFWVKVARSTRHAQPSSD